MKVFFVFAFLLVFGEVHLGSSKVACKRCIKVLNNDIKNAAKKSMQAVVEAGVGLSRIRDQFNSEQTNLILNLKKARAMISLISNRIKTKVNDVVGILETALHEAKDKLRGVDAASDALGAIEDNVGARKVNYKAKRVRQKIAKEPGKNTAEEKQILTENGLITTIDAARILAESKAKNEEMQTEKREKIVEGDLQSLTTKMSQEEKALDDEENLELKDEMEAKNKIRDAVRHNELAMNKARKFLKDIEDGISQFHKDIEKVPLEEGKTN